jgi:hypothetical protein
MPDYKNGKIYTIRCSEDPTLIYVGSTTQSLSQRWTDHKKNCNNDKSKSHHFKIYTKLRELGIEKFYIELYEDCACENKEHLLKREGEVIREIGTLNSRIEGRTLKEYYNDNKEHRSQTHKEWYTLNRESVLKKVKEHVIKNQDKLNEYRTCKVLCDCGQNISYTHFSRHKQTKKHADLVDAKNSQTKE